MHQPRSIVGTLLEFRWISSAKRRRGVFAIAVVITLILSIFPRVYVSQVQLNQPSSSAAGLGALLGQLGGNYAALLGGGQPYEVDLAVGRSVYVQSEVIRRLNLIGSPGYADMRQGLKTIDRITNIDSLRGAIIKISVRDHDQDFALRMANVYAGVFRDRLAELGRQQTAYKRRVLNDRLSEATRRLATAQAAVNNFRATNRLPDPQSELAASVSALSGLKSQLQQQESDIQASLRFRTPDSYEVKVLEAKAAATRSAINSSNENKVSNGTQTAAQLSAMSNRYINLLRDLAFAQTLYESYTKYLEGAAVEDESANWNIQVLQPAYIEGDIAFNKRWLAALICVILVSICLEFYVFAPPVRGRSAVNIND